MFQLKIDLHRFWPTALAFSWYPLQMNRLESGFLITFNLSLHCMQFVTTFWAPESIGTLICLIKSIEESLKVCVSLNHAKLEDSSSSEEAHLNEEERIVAFKIHLVENVVTHFSDQTHLVSPIQIDGVFRTHIWIWLKTMAGQFFFLFQALYIIMLTHNYCCKAFIGGKKLLLKMTWCKGGVITSVWNTNCISTAMSWYIFQIWLCNI